MSNTLATSDGRMLRAPAIRARESRRLQRLQQQPARQRKGSQRRARSKRQIARVHQTVRDRRRNWIEIQTPRLVCDHDLVAVESLNVKGMVRRPCPKPDPEAPGTFRQQCRARGHAAAANRQSQAVFCCESCGHHAHADSNAAENILARALALAPTPGPGASKPTPPAARVRRPPRRRGNQPRELADAA